MVSLDEATLRPIVFLSRHLIGAWVSDSRHANINLTGKIPMTTPISGKEIVCFHNAGDYLVCPVDRIKIQEYIAKNPNMVFHLPDAAKAKTSTPAARSRARNQI
jgi:hypothetical protein